MSSSQQNQKQANSNSNLSDETLESENPNQPIIIASTEAEFIRVSNDLEIKTPIDSMIIADYFVDQPPIQTAEGIILSANNMVARHQQNQTQPLLLADNGAAITPSTPKTIGTISATVAGPITVQGIDGTPRTVNEGEPIYLHDTIMTSAYSYVRITLTDGTLFQLGPDSHASMDKYTYHPDLGSGEFESTVSSGAFRYISGKISGHNQGQHTTIKTPSAYIGIRGSEIDAVIGEDGSTTVLHLSGLVTITSRHNLKEIIAFERGTSVYIPNENLSHTIEQRSEEHIQQRNQEWHPISDKGNSVEEDLSGKTGIQAPKLDNGTYPQDDGARNPFSPEDIADEHEKPSAIEVPDEDNDTTTGKPSNKDDEEPTNLHPEPPADQNDTAHLGEDTNPPGDENPKPADKDSESPNDGTNQPAPNETNNTPTDNTTKANESVLEQSLDEDHSQIIQLPEGSTGQITQLTQPEHGEVVNNGDGTLTYIPAANFNGQDSFTYMIDQTNSVLVKLTIHPINDAPVAGDDSFTLVPNTPLDISANSLLKNDQDVEDDPLQIVNIGNPENGAFNLLESGEIELLIGEKATRTGFDYTVSDGDKTDIGHVNLTVLSDSPLPTANDENVSISNPAPLPSEEPRDSPPSTANDDVSISNPAPSDSPPLTANDDIVSISNPAPSDSPPLTANDDMSSISQVAPETTAAQLLDNQSVPNSQFNPSQDQIDAKLAGEEVQTFIDGLINDHFEEAIFDDKIDSDRDSDPATVTMSGLKDNTQANQLQDTDQLDFDKTTKSTLASSTDDDPNNLPDDWQDTNEITSTGDNQPLKLTDVLDITDTTHLVEGNATSSTNSVGQNSSNDNIDSSSLHNHYSSDAAELLVNVDMTHQLIV